MSRKSDRSRGFGARMMQAALALLYPARCVACDVGLDDDVIFCEPCEASLLPIEAACPGCARPLPKHDGRPPPCIGCLEQPHRFRGAASAFEFGGSISDAIRRLKWGKLQELAPSLGVLLDEGLCRAPPEYQSAEVIVPVPLHRARLRKREFNQAAVLAAALRDAARDRGSPLGAVPIDVRALARVRDTPPQTELSAVQRRANVLGAFAVRKPERVAGKRVLLVDDVMTTGATADACTSALRAANAADVLVLTLGRAMP